MELVKVGLIEAEALNIVNGYSYCGFLQRVGYLYAVVDIGINGCV